MPLTQLSPSSVRFSKMTVGQKQFKFPRTPLPICGAFCHDCATASVQKGLGKLHKVQGNHGAHYSTGIWKPAFHCRLILQFNPTAGLIIARCEGGAAQRGESEEAQEWILASIVLDPWQGWAQTSKWQLSVGCKNNIGERTRNIFT